MAAGATKKASRSGLNRKEIPNPQIPLPNKMYLPLRKNSKGYDIDNEITRLKMKNIFSSFDNKIKVTSLINGLETKEDFKNIYNPAKLDQLLGKVAYANDDTIDNSLNISSDFFSKWKNIEVEEKIKIINKFANLLEENAEELIKICVLEAGKTIKDSIDDLREAIDFCYYYSSEALRLFSEPYFLKGPTGERNKLVYEGKGVIFAISPWNFPIAIFVGQIVAPLLAGNTVIAKPAEQTSILAYEIMKLFLKAGLPSGSLQLLLGEGKKIGDIILEDNRIKGVMFTGSNETAKYIKNKISKRDGEIIPFAAETGGINVMIVDSSALTEQVIDDAIESGFGAAGQRCSALRIMAIQEEVFQKTIKMLSGALKKIEVGDPRLLETDIGPVIDQEAKNRIKNHLKRNQNNIISELNNKNNFEGYFVNPTIINIEKLKDLKEEIFGPVIHVIKFKAKELEKLVDDVNNLNYGLTLGIQSRIDNTINYIFNNAKVGNVYVNRNIVGAVVGVQPFGGRGLSGTGAKAGGPNYLIQFVNEKTFSYNTTAAGGNASLMMLEENK